jgi:hypothetical protein
MCELELIGVAQITPGESARGFLRFAPGVERIVRELAADGPISRSLKVGEL